MSTTLTGMSEKLLPQITKACNECRLRPRLIFIDDPQPYIKRKLGKFFSINYFWDESYFDKIYFTKEIQIKNLMTKTEEIITKLGGYSKHDWGMSDGHLFVYITINL